MWKNIVGKIESWREKYAILRFFTSFVPMAFCYGLFLFAYEIKFLRELIPVVHPVLMAWAALVAAYSLFIRKDWKKIKGWQVLLAFIISVFLTTLLNLKAGLVSNIKGFIFTLLPLFAFLPALLSERGEEKKKSFLKIFSGAAVLMCVASLIALIMYLMRFGEDVELFGIKERLGLRLYDETIENSGVILFGIYKDTNHAAIYALCFALYSVFLFVECKKGIFEQRWLNITCMVFAGVSFFVQLFYFPLANSRGGWLSLLVILAVVGSLFFLFGRTDKPFCCKHYAQAALGTLLVLVISVGALFGIRSAWANLSYEIAGNTSGNTGIESVVPPLDSEGDPSSGGSNEAGGNSSGGNVDSFVKPENGGAGRLYIWKEAWQLYLKKPLFGQNTNNAFYGKLYMPDGKIASGAALHNSYLDLLVDYGAVGFLLLIGFFVICIIQIVRRVFQKRALGLAFYLVLAIAILVACGSALLSCTFVNSTAMYFLLLISLGYLIGGEKDEEREAEEEIEE